MMANTDPRKAGLLEKYQDGVDRSIHRLKNCAEHMHTRRMAMAAIEGDLAPFWANELCTYLITPQERNAIIEETLAKYNIVENGYANDLDNSGDLSECKKGNVITMLKTKAAFKRKDPEVEVNDCVIERIVRLDSGDFFHFKHNLLQDYDFIRDNNHLPCSFDTEGVAHCLLVLDRDGEDGILVRSEGADYARYSSYMPGAKYFVEACQETQSMKFYCPLTAETYAEMDEEERQFASEGEYVDPEAYEDYIREKIVEYNHLDDERGLATYLDNELKDKVWSINADVEMRGDTLYGVFIIEVREDLSPQELEKLREYCSGQASDGWGEGFEQREIDTPDGEIYVHFWDSGDDYFMLTEDEFEQRMNTPAQEIVPEELSVAEQLEAKIEKNFALYANKNMELSNSEVFDMAREISVVQDTYNDLLHNEWDETEINTLMAYENPLELISNIRLDANREISTDGAVSTLIRCPELGEGYPMDESYVPPDQSQGMTMQ